MPSGSRLVDLPAELLEAVILHLDFKDVCNLRLTAREIAGKASQGSFKAHFINKCVDASQSDLQRLVTVTQKGWLGCALEHLTIVSDVSAADSGAHEQHEQETSGLLVKALTQLRTNSRIGHLRSVTLSLSGTTKKRDLSHYSGYVYAWQTISQCVGETARLVALAVQASAIPVESLNLYGYAERCALDSNQLDFIVQTLVMSELRSLSLAITGTDVGDVDSENVGLADNLCRFLAQSPNLEHLDIRWFNFCLVDLSDANLEDRRFFTRISALSIPSLTSVSLRGIYATADVLLAFLTRHPQLRHLRMEELHLEQGKFTAVFAHITENLRLESLDLNDLWESRLIQFIGATGEPHFPHSGGPTWISRKELETRRTIAYKIMTGRTKASVKNNAWHRKRGRLYGPPDRGI